MFSLSRGRARSFAKRSVATLLFATLAAAGLVGATASSAHASLTPITQYPDGCRGAAYGADPQGDWRYNCWLGQDSSVDSHSNFVAAVQVILNDLRINTGGIDGIFGPQTRNAVIWFQATHGLKRDGFVGANTWAMLGAQLVYQGHGPVCPGCGNVWWFGVQLPNGRIDSHRFFSVDDPNPHQRDYWFRHPVYGWMMMEDMDSLVA